MNNTYLTTDELSARIKYDVRTIRNQLKDSVLLEGIHYVRPFGGRKILYVWEKIEQDMFKTPMIDVSMCSGQVKLATDLLVNPVIFLSFIWAHATIVFMRP